MNIFSSAPRTAASSEVATQRPEVSAAKADTSDFVVVRRDSLALGAVSTAIGDQKSPNASQLAPNLMVGSGSLLLRRRPQVSYGEKFSLPPEIPTNATIRQRFRFYTSSAASDEAITVSDVFGALGVVGRVSNTSFTQIASSFRIRGIDVWMAPNLGSCEIAWLASDITRVKDETMSIAAPSGSTLARKCHFSPPKSSVANDWVYGTMTGSVQLFRLSLPQGSIMDLDVEWTTNTGHITMSAINSVSGSVTVGAFYRLYLDRTAGNGYIRPLAYSANTVAVGQPLQDAHNSNW